MLTDLVLVDDSLYYKVYVQFLITIFCSYPFQDQGETNPNHFNSIPMDADSKIQELLICWYIPYQLQ